jgi:4-amino-4-deoxy-L-arabinose transferase-like glycosyltransferase
MWKTITILFAVYACVRIIHLTLLPIFNDEAIYLDWGWRETHTPGLLYYSLYDSKPPLLMWLFGLSESIVADPLFAGRFVSVLCGAVTLLGIYRITIRFFNPTIAILASLLYSIIPLYVFFDRQALMESALGAIGVWICYSLLQLWQTQKEKYIYYLGILLGVGFFIKFSAGVYIAALFLIYLARILKHKQNLMLIKQLSIISGVFCAVITLLLINPEFWSTLPRNVQYSLTISELMYLPFATWIKNIQINILISFFYLTPFVFLTAAVGILVFLQKGTKIERLLAFWILLCLLIQTLLVRTSSQRYLVAFLPLLVIPSSYVLQKIFMKQKFLGLIICLVALGIPLFFTLELLIVPQDYIHIMSKLNKYSEIGYITGQTSGYGIAEVKDYLDTRSKYQKIFVGLANNTGDPENALIVYYEKSNHITTGVLDGKDFGNALYNFDCLHFPVLFYYVSRNSELNGLEKFLVKTNTVHTPYSSYTLGIYTTKQPCRGKTLEIVRNNN